jgi:hypothetical protein
MKRRLLSTRNVEHQKALYIQTRIRGGDSHLYVAASYNGLGIVCQSPGKYEEALENHQKDLDTTVRLVGEALEMHTKSLDIKTRI